jgi:threonine/homoserine/homoserine lactone efflux protein
MAIGPVVFFIINLTLQKTLLDWLVGALAISLVDIFYITLTTFWIGVILKKKKVNYIFGIISSIILIIFGGIILKSIMNEQIISNIVHINNSNLISSFFQTFLFTIFNPMTIIFFTSIVYAKTIEYNYKNNELIIFSYSIWLATPIFMWTIVILIWLIKWSLPMFLIQILNWIVWLLLIIYWTIRLFKNLKKNKQA